MPAMSHSPIHFPGCGKVSGEGRGRGVETPAGARPHLSWPSGRTVSAGPAALSPGPEPAAWGPGPLTGVLEVGTAGGEGGVWLGVPETCLQPETGEAAMLGEGRSC